MKIAIGCDHGALELKNVMVAHLTKKGYEVKEFGTYTPDSCDYPEFAEAAAKAVASGECDKGIVLCTTGIGVSITANKVKGIYNCINAAMPGFLKHHRGSVVTVSSSAPWSQPIAIFIIVSSYMT